MKKLFIVLAVIVLLRVGSIAYLETQLLDEPIILTQEVNLMSDSLYVSYITNRIEPHNISVIQYGDMNLYPNREFDFFEFDMSSKEMNEYVGGRLYSIHSLTLPLDLEERGIDLPSNTTATIHFKNGQQFEELITVENRLEEQTVLREEFSSSNGGERIDTFITEQDVTLNNLDISQLDHVILTIASKQIELPLKEPIFIPKDTLIKMDYTIKQLSFYPFEEFEVIFHLLDEKELPVKYSFRNIKNNPPSSKWIHEYVKERAKQ